MSVNQSTIGKAIAIILVVFGHLGFVPNGGALGVSIFLVLSGYGLVKSAERDDYKLKGYWRKRFVSVYLPFLVCSFFTVCLLWLIKYPMINNNYKCYSTILGMIGFPNNPYDPTMWYISYIFMMYLSFWCSFKFFKIKRNRVFICTVYCLIVGIGSIFVYTDSIGVYLYLFSFPIGVIVASYDGIMILLCRMINSCKIGVLMLIIIALEYMSYRNIIFYILLTVCVSLFVIPILMRLRQVKKKLIFIIGKSSFAIYLIEGIMMKIMWEYIGKDKGFWNFLCGLIIVNVGIVIHYIWKLLFGHMKMTLRSDPVPRK